MRLYAMYGCDRVLLALLLSLLLAQTIAQYIILRRIVTGAERELPHLRLLLSADAFVSVLAARLPGYSTGCTLQLLDAGRLWTAFVPLLIFESILLALAVVKVVDTARRGSGTPRILGILLRDSIIYFGGIFSIVLTNLVIYWTGRVRPFDIPIGDNHQ